MRELVEFIRNHVSNIEKDSPAEFHADLFFFKILVVGDPSAERLTELIKNSEKGEFCDVDMFDGKEHSYIEVGGWIGDQTLALQLMGLGFHLKLWKLFTPNMMPVPDQIKSQMAGKGLISVVHQVK